MNRNYSKGDLNKDHFIGGLLLSIAVLISSCSNTTPLRKNNPTIAATQMTPAKSVTSMTAVKPVAVVVDWDKVEALADKKYQDEPLADYYFNILDESERNAAPWFYAKDFNVSIDEAQRRLLLQGISSPLIEAIAEHLGGAVAAIYYDNHDPNEYSIKVTTLNTVTAVPPRYVYHFKQKGFDNYSFPIHIQAIGFSPMTNTINVSIYSKTMSETERKRIEAELTELAGHSVKVEILKNPITAL